MKEEQDLFSSNIDYKKVINRLLSYRIVYIACIIIFLIAAFVVNHFSVKKYTNKTTIYITESENNSLLNSSDMMLNFGMIGNQKIVDNELEVLKSYTLIRSVFDDLNLNVTYYSTKNSALANLFMNTPFTRKTELYKNCPIRVVLDPSIPQPIYMAFKIVFLNDNEFTIESTGEQIALYNYIDDQIVSYVSEIYFGNQRFRFGDEIRTNYFNFRVIREGNFSVDFTTDKNLFFYFNNVNNLTRKYQSAIQAKSTSQNSTIIEVTLKETHREKVTDFLNALTSAYLDRNMEKKNKIASSTVDFIDTQISDVADSLTYAESTLRNFRTSEGVMDLSFQGQQIFEQLTRLEDQKSSLESQKKIYESLRLYLASNDISTLSAPSVMDVVDPILTTLVTNLITLNDERARLLRNSSSQQNLYLNDINAQIEQTKRTLQETVNNNLNTVNINLNEVNYRIRNANSQISEIPKTELKLRSIERKFDINDEIYTFLLQKRSEAQIARASSMPDYEIVDPAVLFMSYPVWPKAPLNYALAFFLALLLPTSFLLIKDFFNNKIADTDEIEQISDYPVLGRVFHSFRRSKLVVNDHPNSSVTECFRSIRTNFQFFSEGGKKQIILITSTSSGEGKTFCSMNLASVFALNGHRTVLLEFDLRRPKIYEEFTSNNMIGISSFLIDKAILEDIILPTQVENMDFIPAGPAAPNPAELINSERTAELIDKLREMYDYIIIDSAPAGILTETHILMKYADLNVLIARLNKTIKEAFKQTLKNIEANKIKNLSLIINDIYIHRESYKYGYDKKYYTDDSNRSLLQRIFGKKRKAS
ncbi:MAG: polysaccharide biosynthesis tyrosine autokinase [Bacteroidales bacterium]|nr:polysaccharide biosynthesis tyrosine autokinase [Bacteroidales bacterium]